MTFSMPSSTSPVASPPLLVSERRLTVTPAPEELIGGGVGAETADDMIGAGQALEHVVKVAADQRVGMGRADQVLDVGDGVAGGVAAAGDDDLAREIDGHGRIGRGSAPQLTPTDTEEIAP